MTTLPLNDDTKQFIIDHWAAIQPKDISAGWNVSAVAFDGSDALVTCNSPVPPSPRIIRVPMARVEAWAGQMGYPPIQAGLSSLAGEGYADSAAVEADEPPAKPKRSSKK